MKNFLQKNWYKIILYNLPMIAILLMIWSYNNAASETVLNNTIEVMNIALYPLLLIQLFLYFFLLARLSLVKVSQQKFKIIWANLLIISCLGIMSICKLVSPLLGNDFGVIREIWLWALAFAVLLAAGQVCLYLFFLIKLIVKKCHDKKANSVL